MPSITVTLSSKGQLVIPKDIRDALHWEAGTRLILVATAAGVTLQAEPRHAGRRLDDLIGMLKHQGPPLATDDLCRPVMQTFDRGFCKAARQAGTAPEVRVWEA